MAEKIIIERTDANELGQQFHVRFVAGNGRRTFWCENLASKASAKKAIVSHIQSFLPAGYDVKFVKAPWPAASGSRLRISSAIFKVDNDIPVIEIDSRTGV